jgi:acetylornithine deacetylase
VNAATARHLAGFVEARRPQLVSLLADLVRLPSENRAPHGAELACQQYLAARLQRTGWDPTLYTPTEVPGITSHPLYWPGRSYDGRPNLGATLPGEGGGRSLLLSGHIDTVPAGSLPWTRPPFGAEIVDGRLYGRGAFDMKAGIAANLFVVEALAELGIRLQGDLTFESVVDEEFGGVNGTLAGRLAGYTADAAILSEPSSLRICPAQRGGRTVHVTFSAPNSGILCPAGAAGVIEQLRLFLNALPRFVEVRRLAAPSHPLYQHLADPIPVTVARVHTAPWSTDEPPNVPPVCRLELFWQTMPGETVDAIDREFHAWLDALVTAHPETFAARPAIEHPIRWLPGSALAEDHPLIDHFAATVQRATGQTPEICGIEGPCDMYVFHQFGVPALLWGPHGGNAHMPDEYVEIDSLVESTKALLTFVCHWCGVASE